MIRKGLAELKKIDFSEEHAHARDHRSNYTGFVGPKYFWLIVLSAASALVIIAFSFQSKDWRSGVSVACTGLMAAFAASMVGAVLGFLFGIPRTLAGDDGQSGGQADGNRGNTTSSDYEDNTNLEQLSDWLTKILVGVGLTQLPKIRENIGQLVALLAPRLGNSPPFALGLLVFFFLCGFLRSYLWTRLRLKSELRSSNQVAELKSETALLRGEAEVAIALAYAMAIVAKSEHDKAAIQPREKAVRWLRRALVAVPDSREVAILLGRLLRRQGKVDDAIKMLTQVITLREKQQPHDEEDTAAILYNRACYWNLLAKNATKISKQNELRERSRADLKRVLEMAPTEREEMSGDADLTEVSDVWGPNKLVPPDDASTKKAGN